MVAADGFLRRLGRALQAIAGLETVGQPWNTDEVFSPIAPPTGDVQVGAPLPPRTDQPVTLPPEESAGDVPWPPPKTGAQPAGDPTSDEDPGRR